MPATLNNQPYKRVIRYGYLAEWRWVDIRPSQDPAALTLGPPFHLQPGERLPENFRPLIDPDAPPIGKDALYIPVKKTKGKEVFPSLGISFCLREERWFENVEVSGHKGQKVTFSVFNVWGKERRGPVTLEATTDDRGACFVTIPSNTVKDWLDPAGKLGGRINELLLDFSFDCPSLAIEGQPLKGQSSNRVFLYRRKVVVFLPGVFGSTVKVKTPDGRVLGYPDYYAEPSSFEKIMDSWHIALGMLPIAPAIKQAWGFANQHVGGLECDADGQPLLRPIKKPSILNLRGVVYDVFDECRAARTKYFHHVPPAFRLVELRVLAYDWRCDLTEGAKELAKSVKAMQSEGPTCLQKLPDFDDEIALAGHSTGGLIMRRALGEEGMESVVSHALFLNVPFRGAPKAMGVVLTGQDPPGGSRMIPFVEPGSLRSLALGMPIVYHLAPSAAYSEHVAFSPERPVSASPPVDIEAEKAALVGAAIKSGFLAPPAYVKSAGLSEGDRAALAATADKWHEFWAEASERRRAQQIYDSVYKQGLPNRDKWFAEELKSRDLETQWASRAVGGWNETLAGRARKFHEESEKVARSGKWSKKAFIFYSLAKSPTTLAIHLEHDGEVVSPDLVPFLSAASVPIHKFTDGDARPPRGEEKRSLSSGGEGPVLTAVQWTAAPHHYGRTKWRLYGVNEIKGGDGTVPKASLLGFGGPATVISAIPGGPEHKDAPGDSFVWERIMEILQGTLVKDDDVEEDADTVKGKPGCPKNASKK